MRNIRIENRDPVWTALREEISAMKLAEPMLAGYLHATVLIHRSLEESLSFLLAGKLASAYLSAMSLRETIDLAFHDSGEIRDAIRRDLRAVVERDPAARGTAEPFLNFKGFHALQAHRVAHYLWGKGRKPFALYFQSRVSEVFGVDIHPAARIGKGRGKAEDRVPRPADGPRHRFRALKGGEESNSASWFSIWHYVPMTDKDVIDA